MKTFDSLDRLNKLSNTDLEHTFSAVDISDKAETDIMLDKNMFLKAELQDANFFLKDRISLRKIYNVNKSSTKKSYEQSCGIGGKDTPICECKIFK